MRRNRRTLVLAAFATAALAACGGSETADGNGAGNTATAPGSASASGGAQTAANSTIAESLGKSADHSSLVGALKAAGLTETMAGAGPYTVFAPTNAAFQKLPAGAGEGLMRPESKAELTDILTYHVVPGVVTAKDLAAALKRGGGKTRLATVGGGTLSLAEADGGITVTDGKNGVARVTQADLVQSNGVVHVVDAVLMPQ
jgi:uncharacterized surface protein with fasciclin (FAS1) repeats